MILLLLACTPHPAALPGWEAMHWEDPRLEGWAGRLHRAAEALPESRHSPAHATGTGWEESWCAGSQGVMGCDGERAARGVEWRRISAISAPGQPEQLVGVELSAGSFPLEGEWGASIEISISSGEERWQLSLLRMVGAGITDQISLGTTLRLQIARSEITVGSAPGEPSPLDQLARLTRSPAPFTAFGSDRVGRLYGEALAALDRGELRRCAYGRYWGDGSPTCEQVPLLDADLPLVRTWLEEERDRRLAHLSSEGDALHALLVSLLGS